MDKKIIHPYDNVLYKKHLFFSQYSLSDLYILEKDLKEYLNHVKEWDDPEKDELIRDISNTLNSLGDYLYNCRNQLIKGIKKILEENERL